MTEPLLLDRLGEIAERYDGFIVDLWGVLHDGVTAFPAALDCLTALRDRGKKVAVLSNAPRRAEAVIARNRVLGITEGHFDALLSSGEETWQYLNQRCDDWYRALGPGCFHLGPERDQGMLEGLDYDIAKDLDRASFVLTTGAHHGDSRVADYQDLLDRARERRLPMICANPDREVIRGGRREICAGAIAEHYRDMGGPVRFHGKPNPSVYRTTLGLLGLSGQARVLGIGDSLRTDVAGAQAAGFDSLFVLGGIHAEVLGVKDGELPPPGRLEGLFAEAGFTPTASMATLRW